MAAAGNGEGVEAVLAFIARPATVCEGMGELWAAAIVWVALPNTWHSSEQGVGSWLGGFERGASRCVRAVRRGDGRTRRSRRSLGRMPASLR